MKRIKWLSSLRLKCYLSIFLAVAFLCSASMLTTYFVHSHNLDGRYSKLRYSVAKNVRGLIDPGKSENYINGYDSEEHIKNNIRLRKLTEDITDIYSIGVYKFTEGGMYTVFDTTSDKIRGGVGDFTKYTKEWENIKNQLLLGETVENVCVHYSAGQTDVYCMPVNQTEDGGYVYICIGVLRSLTESMKSEFFSRNSKGIISIAFAFLALSVIYIEFKVIKPINNITLLVKRAASETNSKFLDEMVASKIKTVEEIEDISRSLIKIYSSKIRLSRVVATESSSKSSAIISILKRMDNFYAMHLDNSSQYTVLLVSALRNIEKYKDKISDRDYEDMLLAAPFHDIGKLAIPNHILNKPSSLTSEEYEIMKQHTVLGAKIIDDLCEGEEPKSYLLLARQIALYHHERWDGAGYPQNLKGEEIPFLARIITVVDVFDALVSKRVYKEAYPFDKAFSIIIEEKGKAFDPEIVDVFVSLREKIYDLYTKIGNQK